MCKPLCSIEDTCLGFPQGVIIIVHTLYLTTCILYSYNTRFIIPLIPESGKRDYKSSPTSSPLATPTSSGTAAPFHSKADSARRHIASELLQTEKNFVNILSIIVNVSKWWCCALYTTLRVLLLVCWTCMYTIQVHVGYMYLPSA